MSNEDDSLRPYPIDLRQDKVVEEVAFVKNDLISRIISFIRYVLTFPFMIISDYLNKRPEDGEEKNANEIGLIYVSTRTEAMDSKFFYAVRDGKIWFKPIGAHPDAPWKLFGGDGFIDNNKTPLILLSADGDNILALDKNEIIHYAKSNGVICEVSFDCPQWTIIKSRVKWTDKWFNMTGVSLIVNLFKNPILKPIKNSRGIAMSHKGFDTMYYTDMKGKKHPDPYIGVTTIYALNEDGTRLFFADPWLQNKFENDLTTPEDGQFKAEILSASASTIFLIQRARNENGKEIHLMYTRYADFDSTGSNPALKATYNPMNKIPLIRFIPAEDWIQQPSISLEGKARLTKNISILQIGCGQNNRQLRVQGQNQFGHNGFYFKNIYNKQWNFQVTDNVIISEEEFLPESFPHTGFEKGPKIVENYENGRLESNLITSLMKISLEKFSRYGLNERGLHTKLVIILDNNFKLSIPLYARRGWESLLGISYRNIWKLVIPIEYFGHDDPFLKEFLHKIFHNKSRHSVNVYEGKDEIIITNVFFTYCKFKFIFKNKSE
ncbi:unnamed protein product [Rotaria sp. Silwood1]|nr:unnamed protein product [Rotaria sp. Silwood1]CAF5004343.1 unnamed protein product [Rotaria sp. Silwood1]